jgi:outer membrane protein OmpA-like peptidoglycan-associated protein
VKTNLWADLTTSMNLAFEFRTGGHTSLDVMGQWNPFSYRGGVTEWRHIGVQPELRYWTRETFRGHFFGAHLHYAFYNVGGLPNGPFTDYMHNNRFEGDLYGLGVSWGHRWNFSRRWGLEVTAVVGYAHKGYDRYKCEACSEVLETKSKNYFGPTKLGVNLIFGGGAKKTPVVVAPPVAPPAKVRYEPTLKPEFIVPAAEAVKVRNESGSAYLEFPVGRSTILPTFRGNAAELAKIEEMVSRVKNDADATITAITLTGNASPEGSYSSNMSLSERRAEALKGYLINLYKFPSSLVAARGAGEDWAGLSRLVGESYIAGKGALLDVINGSADYDARDRAMLAASAEGFAEIKSAIYPKLRRTDYKLDFEVRPITVERGKEVMRTNPRNLSLNELFMIADSYAASSTEFREVMEIAARTYPDSDVANNNVAAAALQRKDLTAAASYLAKVTGRDADWNNNMGILSFLQGNAQKAAEHFAAAGAKGSANAAEIRRHLESIR